jgi:HEAT repeat protein
LRQDIADVLGRIGPDAKDAVPALASVLLENDSALRGRAATALGAIGPEAKAAVPKLVLALEDRSTLESVVAALAKIGKPAVSGLTNALTDKNPAVRLGAAVALGRIGPDARSAVPALSLRYTKDRYLEVREAARIALKAIQVKA